MSQRVPAVVQELETLGVKMCALDAQYRVHDGLSSRIKMYWPTFAPVCLSVCLPLSLSFSEE